MQTNIVDGSFIGLLFSVPLYHAFIPSRLFETYFNEAFKFKNTWICCLILDSIKYFAHLFWKNQKFYTFIL